VSVDEGFNMGLARDGIRVDSTLAEGDQEVAVKTPFRTPGVGDDPVVGSVFVAPTDDLDSVTAQQFTTLVSVDTILVVHEIFIDLHTSVNGTEFHDVGLNGLRVGQDSDSASLSVVLLEGVTVFALADARGDGTVSGDIGEAGVFNNTGGLQELP